MFKLASYRQLSFGYYSSHAAPFHIWFLFCNYIIVIRRLLQLNNKKRKESVVVGNLICNLFPS